MVVFQSDVFVWLKYIAKEAIMDSDMVGKSQRMSVQKLAFKGTLCV